MRNLTYWLGVNITLAKTNEKNTKKDVKKWAVRILVLLLAATFIVSTLIAVLPAFFM